MAPASPSFVGPGQGGLPIDWRNERAANLIANASLEIGVNRPEDIGLVAAALPPGTQVFVPHLPRQGLSASLACAVALRAVGLAPVVHVAARRVGSRAEVAAFLDDAARRAGCARVLVIGGDAQTQEGPYADALALLDDNVLQDVGFRAVSFGAYPDGHPSIPAQAMDAALDAKIARASSAGLAPSIVTQFSFDTEKTVAFADWLARRHAGVPVDLGIAGPAGVKSLLKFAAICGVKASLRAIAKLGRDAMRLAGNVDPTPLYEALVARAPRNVRSVHVFSFGGTAVTAAWLRAKRDAANVVSSTNKGGTT